MPRLAACAATMAAITPAVCGKAIAVSSCHFSSNAMHTAMAPNAPMRESCMMRSRSSGV
jgi:hypothetical protein